MATWLAYVAALPVAMILLLRFLALVLPSRLSQLAYFAFFSLTAFGLFVLCCAYGVFASAFLRVIGYGGISQWATGRSFKWSMWLATGMFFDVRGSMKREAGISGEDALHMRPVVFVGNHQTELDVLMLGTMFPKWCSVTAKNELKYWPFVGWFMSLSNTLFIKRGNRSSALAIFQHAASTMNSTRQSVFIFPEGTRSYATTPTLLPFKKGAFHLAVQAQVPLVPVVCANYSHVLDVANKIARPGIVDVIVLPPVSTKGMGVEDIPQLVEVVRAKMLDELARLEEVKRNSGVKSSSSSSRGSSNGGAAVVVEPDVGHASGSVTTNGGHVRKRAEMGE